MEVYSLQLSKQRLPGYPVLTIVAFKTTLIWQPRMSYFWFLSDHYQQRNPATSVTRFESQQLGPEVGPLRQLRPPTDHLKQTVSMK